MNISVPGFEAKLDPSLLPCPNPSYCGCTTHATQRMLPRVASNGEGFYFTLSVWVEEDGLHHSQATVSENEHMRDWILGTGEGMTPGDAALRARRDAVTNILVRQQQRDIHEGRRR